MKRIKLIILFLTVFVLSFSLFVDTGSAWSDNTVGYLQTIQGPVKYLSSSRLLFTFPFAKEYAIISLKLLKNKANSSGNYDKYYYNNAENRITIQPYPLSQQSGRIDTGFVTEYGFSYLHPFAVHIISGLNWAYWDGSDPWYPDMITMSNKWVAHGINMKNASVSISFPASISVSSSFTASYVTISFSESQVRSLYFNYGEEYSSPINFYGDIFNISQTVTSGFVFRHSGSGYYHTISANRTVYIS